MDKYNIPYEELHTLEDLEPWLKLIQEKEPGVVPFYCTKDYTAPTYMDKIVDPIGIEYGDETLTVRNLFETEKMMSTLRTMRKYYEAGYGERIMKTVMLVEDEDLILQGLRHIIDWEEISDTTTVCVISPVFWIF